jgi:NitT/TauT family transport system substrate-binding protein
MKDMASNRLLLIPLFTAACCATAQAQPMEKVKVATTFLGLWDTSQPTFCKDRGEFAKAGLDVEVTSTRGGSENVQAVVVGGADIGFSPGTNAVLAAYGKGAKIKIISAEFMGQNDTFFYVPAASPIKSINDLAGKSVAYPRPGGAGEAILLALKAERKINFEPVATGGMDATFTMTMTKQVDVGYSVPPSVLQEVNDGKVRVVFAGDEVEGLKSLTGRVVIASDAFLEKKRDVAKKFMEVLDKCIDWAYANKAESAKMYGALNKIDAKVAEQGLAFYKREALAFGPVKGLEGVLQQAIDGKFIEKPLTPDQVSRLMDIVYTTK